MRDIFLFIYKFTLLGMATNASTAFISSLLVQYLFGSGLGRTFPELGSRVTAHYSLYLADCTFIGQCSKGTLSHAELGTSLFEIAKSLFAIE